MLNITKRAVPATLKRWAHLIDDIEDYRDQGPDGDGYWVHLVPGWRDEGTETHSVHEDNITQCAARFRGMVRPCACEGCMKLIAAAKAAEQPEAFDPENVYGSATMAQSIAESRK